MSNKTTTMTLVETINYIHMEKIIQNYPKLLESGFEIYNEEGEVYFNTLYPILHKYLNQLNKISKELGTTKIEYVKPKNIPKKVHGRVYPKDSVGVVAFPRYIRNYLLVDTNLQPLVVDIDIKNCHPVIYLQYLLNEEQYPKEKLTHFIDYIENRDEWIKKYGKEIKTEIIAVLNCCQALRSITKADKKYDNLIKEIWDSQDYLSSKHNLKDLTETKKYIYNTNTTIERKIIDIAMEYITMITKVDISTYAYDGFMVPKNNEFFENDYYVSELLLPHISKRVFEHTGYKVEFLTKDLELNQEMIDIINNGLSLEENKRLENSTQMTLENGKFLGDYINDNIFEDYKEDIFVFKSAMGDGKTFKIYNDILDLRKQNKDITSISILNRISLTDNVRYDYPFTWSYRERNGDTAKINAVGKSVIICCESLHRLTPNTMRKCDYLILDELMSLLPQLQCAETHQKNMKINQHHFWGLVKTAKKIVIMDANVDQDTIDYIKKIRQEEHPNVMVQSYEINPRKEKQIKFYDDDIYFTEKLLTSLDNGNKIFIPNTRNIDYGNGIIQTILGKYPSKKCIYINSRTKDEYKEYIEDTSKWSKFDVVMISPTISCGVSCVIKNHFDEVWGFLSNISCNPLDATQMFGRVRYPNTNNIHIHINSQHHQMYKHANLNREKVLQMLYTNMDNLYNMNKTLVETKFNYKTFTEELVYNERTELFIHNFIKQSKHYKLYEFFLRRSFENSYICKFLWDSNINGKCELQETLLDNIKESKNTIAKAIFTAENIGEYEAELLKNDNQHENNPAYQKFIYHHRMEMSLENLDNFVKNNINTKRDYGQLKKYIDSNIIPTTKIIKNIIGNSKVYNTIFNNTLISSHNDVGLTLEQEEHIFNDVSPFYAFESGVNFGIRPYDLKDLSTIQHFEIMKGTLTKVLWVDKIMRVCFNQNRSLYENLQTTSEGLEEAFTKFIKFYYQKNKDYSHSKRLYDLFGINYYNRSDFEKLRPYQKKEIFNKLLHSVGLNLRTLNTRRKRINGKQEYVNDGIILMLTHPVILDERLPIKLEKVSINKKDLDSEVVDNTLKLDINTIPIINTNTDRRNYTQKDLNEILNNTYLDKYYNSVFYNLKY
jgi:hypothetical protein